MYCVKLDVLHVLEDDFENLKRGFKTFCCIDQKQNKVIKTYVIVSNRLHATCDIQ